jgi:hypothetical protein
MDSLPFYINNLGPAIVRQLTSATGGEFDITTGQSFKLRVRARDASTVLLDKTMTPDVTENTVTYQPVLSDTVFTTEGVYRAWVYYVEGKQDTDEFEILVMDHAPGELARIGAIWRAARALEPVAWDALRGYPDYGDPELQRVIELAKLRVIGTAVPVADEASVDPRIVDYIAKKVLADNVLYAAISFWTNQVIQQSARGNSDEVVSYPDRIRATEEAIKRYRDDLERQAGELPEGSATAYNAPALLDAGVMLTPGLDEYPAQPVRLPYWIQSARDARY